MAYSEIDQSSTDHLITQFNEEREVEYGGERYLVRDNGAVFRYNQFRKRARPLDKKWTFGRQSPSTGYKHIAGVPVHRIVCSAFHDAPPTDNHVVDHIDTNRANNRAENLRWVTRLENVLLNPISMRRIELVYGSIEAFFSDPARIQVEKQYPDISWMRTVSMDEALTAKKRLKKWAESETVPKGGALGEWLYGPSGSARFEPEPEEFESLTPSVIQVKWKTPTEFPSCPVEVGPKALQEYAENLTFGSVFSKNRYWQSLVVDKSFSGTELFVLTHNIDSIKDWGVAVISIGGEFFFHKSEGTFFELAGAVKAFADLSGQEHEIGDTFDDFC